jgi:hypothetical protein
MTRSFPPLLSTARWTSPRTLALPNRSPSMLYGPMSTEEERGEGNGAAERPGQAEIPWQGRVGYSSTVCALLWLLPSTVVPRTVRIGTEDWYSTTGIFCSARGRPRRNLGETPLPRGHPPTPLPNLPPPAPPPSHPAPQPITPPHLYTPDIPERTARGTQVEVDAFCSIHDMIHSAIEACGGRASLRDVYDGCMRRGRIAYKRTGGSR